MSATSPSDSPTVLILGAGINGACVARELLLNGVPVVVADREDIACGATSKSSRLIHGGLRYLEYGDVGLVRESLEERARLLKLAPQFVRPLRLFIPVRRRHGGLLQAAIRFLKLERIGLGRWLARRIPVSERGLWAVRCGLTVYDWIARRSGLPPHAVSRIDQAGIPAFDHRQFRWACSYYDAQMLFPERFTLALLEDCRQIAEQQHVRFEVLPYHTAQRDGIRIGLRAMRGGETQWLTPATVVNASGAWGDETLHSLQTEAPTLFAGTKGSHIITRQPPLLRAIGNDAVYAEASDGRLVFVLPFGDAVLIGTTDLPFTESPEHALATPEEAAYLVGIVNEVLPDVKLGTSDVAAHYCGVRPLPNVQASRAGAIPRGHSIESQTVDGLAIDTLIGGKLTTCRAFGAFAAKRILQRIGRPRKASTRERPVPGSENAPADAAELNDVIARIAQATGFDEAQVAAMWPLVGARAESILKECTAAERGDLPGTALPIAFVDWTIEHEWVTSLDDLIERRLILAWSAQLSVDLLRTLAQRLVHAGKLAEADVDSTIERTQERLALHYGRSL